MRFAYETKDGGVAIVTAAAKADLERVLGRLTDQQYRDHVIERSIPKGVKWTELKDGWVQPSDRSFRDAWKLTNSVVALDMPKARGVFMGRVRKARAEKLDALDKEWMKATGQGKGADEVEAKRQNLRDLPQTLNVDEAFTAEALQALWPDELK
jgi:hypothetical protein